LIPPEALSDSRAELAKFWRRRLEAARQEFDCALEEFRASVQAFNVQSTSSAVVRRLQLALHISNRAQEEYLRVLRVLTDLVVHGRQPPDL